MKKNVLSLAVATSVSALALGSAQLATAQQGTSMYQNHDGKGEVLLFPFYDAENGNATNMHIVNTTDRVKAVKVRFLEYKASIEVLDFNLYLSPYDHFAFGVVMDPNGTGGAIVTSDNSCTVPALGSANNGFDGTAVEQADGSIVRTQPFVNFEFVRGKYVDQDVARTLRGHVEVIEMGELSDTKLGFPATPTQEAQQFATWATHDASGSPANCAGLAASFTGLGSWAGEGESVNTNVSAPAGGLYGLAYHINVEDAAAWGFEPTAIADWSATPVHALPGDLTPSLSSGNTDSIVVANGVSYERAYSLGIDAVSSLMMTTSITNDVQLNAAIGGQTDWVTTFPTKRDYVVSDLAPLVPALTPFTEPYYGRKLNAAETAYEEELSCEDVSIRGWSREELTAGGGGTSFSPRPPGAAGDEICDEQHTAAWGTGTDSALNVERDLYNVAFAYSEGWARWTFTNGQNFLPVDPSASNQVSGSGWKGLPAVGFAAYKYANGSAGSVMMNYGHAADHKTNTVWSDGS
ncbi:hypothetical protein N9Y37_10465 [Luminiphilus sp.]|nr:hypothetical protein [Luminiphilus sp.]